MTVIECEFHGLINYNPFVRFIHVHVKHLSYLSGVSTDVSNRPRGVSWCVWSILRFIVNVKNLNNTVAILGPSIVAGGILTSRLPCAWIVCRSLSFWVPLLYPYLLCTKHTVYIFSLNYLYAHKTTNLTSFMVEENGNNCLPQLVTSIVIPQCNSINNSDDGAAVELSTLPRESHLNLCRVFWNVACLLSPPLPFPIQSGCPLAGGLTLYRCAASATRKSKRA